MAESVLGDGGIVGTGLFVDPLTGDDQFGQGFHLGAGGVVEGRARIRRIGRTDAANLLPRIGHGIGGGVGDAAVRPGVPGVQIERLILHPGTVARAELQGGHPHDPVGGGAEHRDEGHEVVLAIHPEDGVGFAVDVGVPQAARFDDGADVIRLGFQLGLERLGGAPFGHLAESVRGDPAVLPDAVVGRVRRSDDVAEVGEPFVGRIVARMRLPRPQSFEHDLGKRFNFKTARKGEKED